MERILFLANTEPDGTLAPPSRQVLRAAVEARQALAGSTLTVGLFGTETAAAAGKLGGCGVDKVLSATESELGVSRYASDAAAAEALVRSCGATIVLAPGVPRLARALPGVAQRVDGRIDTRIVALAAADDTLRVQRWFYRQRIHGTLARTHRPWILLVDPGNFEPWPEAAASIPVESAAVKLPEDVGRTQVVGVEEASAESRTIRPEAEVLLVAGAGWTKKQPDGATHSPDAERLILGFLEHASASLGSSKSLVDQSAEGQAVLGCLTHLHQVGQTGSTPRHPKGLATCCHGEEPHVVGWRFVRERRAVNLDPACGWARGKADVLYVADAFHVLEKVNEMLAQRSPAR